MSFKSKTAQYMKNAHEIESDLLDEIKDYVKESGIDAKIIDCAIYGSRSRGLQKPDSDLDIVVQYDGSIKESAMFNLLAEMHLIKDGMQVDINPIRKEESGTLDAYLQKAEQYMKSKGAKDSMNNEGMKQANMLANWFESNKVQVNDVTINFMVKANDSEMIFTVMSDGSVKKTDDGSSNAVAYANAEEAIRSMQHINKDSMSFLSENEKDSYHKQCAFDIIINAQDFSSHFDEQINASNAQMYFDDMTVKAVKDGKIYLTYLGNVTEEPATVAVDIENKYGVKALSVKKQYTQQKD
jgi:predicted nucleotidyltransferase